MIKEFNPPQTYRGSNHNHKSIELTTTTNISSLKSQAQKCRTGNNHKHIEPQITIPKVKNWQQP